MRQEAPLLKCLRRFTCFLVCCAFLISLARAQQITGDAAVGFPANGMFSGSSVESVQLNNGNLHVEIPIWSYPGRGLKSGAAFIYDSKGWFVFTQQNNTQFVSDIEAEPGNTLQLAIHMLGTPATVTKQEIGFKQTLDCNGTTISDDRFTGYVARDADGTKHQLVPDDESTVANQNCIPSTGVMYAADGSGVVYNQFGVVDKDGNTANSDRNGNGIGTNASGALVDTLGRTFSSDGSYIDSSGTKHALTIANATVAINTHICNSSVAGSCGEFSATWTEPSTITLPNGLFYKIGYEENGEGDGEITSIVYPTGARVDYTYASSDLTGPRVHTRKVTVGSQVSTWTYDYSYQGNGVTRITLLTVTDPEKNQTKYTCTPFSNGLTTENFTPENPQPCWMTEADYYDSNGSLVKKVATGYSGAGLPLPTSQVTTWVASNQVSEVDTTYDSQTITVGKAGDVYTAPFSWGNPTDVYEYAYGTGAKGALLRHTHHDYLHLSSANTNANNSNWALYQALNIADKETSTIIYDGSSNPVSGTYFYYDGSATTSTNNKAVSHDYTDYSTANTIRGNLTKESRWLNVSGTVKSETNYTYDDLGNRLTEKDPNGYTTTFSYADRFADTDCVPTTVMTYAFPTLITDALGHRTSHTYYSCTSQTASTADENDIVAKRAGTTYTYDLMNRASGISYPDLGNTTKTYSATLPYQATTTTAMSSSTSHVVTEEFDGLGRISQTQDSTPQGTVLTDTDYDLLGRVESVSNPYIGSTTSGSISYQYDLFGRKTIETEQDGSTHQWCYDDEASPSGQSNCSARAGKLSAGTWVDYSDEAGRHWQRVSDAAGRLTNVFEPDPGSNSLSLETDYSYDALNNLLRIDQWGGANGTAGERIRTFGYDALSRLVCSGNPEIGSGSCPSTDTGAYINGTIRYTYDLNGNVLTKEGPAPASSGSPALTTTTNSYDAVNRLLMSTHSDGTPAERFTYDAGAAANNPVGHLTMENRYYTPSGGGTVTMAQRQYTQFDAMGRLKQESQCSVPNCPGTLYSPSYTYDLAGNMITESNGVPSQPITLTYGYDSAEHLKTITSSWSDAQHPSTLFQPPSGSLAQYDAFGHLANAGLALNPNTQQPSITLSRTYDVRGRISSETDTGAVLIPSAVPSSGSITISGSEQSQPGTQTAATATITVSGQGLTHLQCSGSSVAPTPDIPPPNCQTVADTGSFQFVINGVALTAYWSGGGQSAASTAQGMAAYLSGSGSPVTATASGAVVTLTSNVQGPGGDYPLSVTYVLGSGSKQDFTLAFSGSSLTGGTSNPTLYDSGAITATINGNSASASFAQGSTSSAIASSLASAIQAKMSGFINSSASGNTINLSSTTTGPTTNWPISTGVSYNSAHFSSSSFAASSSGMTGGASNQIQDSTLYSFSITTPNGSSGYAANGNLAAFNDSVMGQWNLGYDYLNRLTQASGVGGTYGGQNISGQTLTWSYDAFGNRTAQSSNGSLLPTAWAHFTTSDNRASATNNISAVVYDPAGNVENDGINVLAFDAESHICGVANAGGSRWVYVTDAGGNRVVQGSASSGWNCSPDSSNGFSPVYTSVLGRSGEQFSEIGSSNNWLHTNVYANGELLATYSGSTVYFALSDWLGTKRVEATPDGKLSSTFQSLPFGDGLLSTGGPDASEHHFTGKLHDSASGLDFFDARYYSSGSGRFVTPDWSEKPEDVPYSDLTDPQSLNIYAYVRNNPLSHTDPDGHGPFGNNFAAWGSWLFGNPQSPEPPDFTDFYEFARESMAGGRRSTGGAALLQGALAQQQNAGASPSSGGTSTTVTLNIGGQKVTVAYSYGKIFSNYGGGVDITATPQNCSGCAWAQVYSRGSGAKKDGDGIGPLYGDEGRGLSVFYDTPASSSPGRFTATTILGTTDISGKSFTAIGGFTYGYSINANGGVTMMAPSVATRNQMSGAIQVLQNNSPDWTIH